VWARLEGLPLNGRRIFGRRYAHTFGGYMGYYIIVCAAECLSIPGSAAPAGLAQHFDVESGGGSGTLVVQGEERQQ